MPKTRAEVIQARDKLTKQLEALEAKMSKTPIYSAAWWALSARFDRAAGLH